MWSKQLQALTECFDKYPLPQGASFAYGTAGFRCAGTLLRSVGCRIALVCALRSATSGGRSVGLMITASHNPAHDNGVKIVDTDGSMLQRLWEPLATSIANAKDAKTALEVVNAFIASQNIKIPTNSDSFKAAVHLARDTRPSGIDIAQSFTEGMAALGSESEYRVINHGLMTTPQLHTMVYMHNVERCPGVQIGDYYSRILGSFEALFRGLVPAGSKPVRVVVDCANGIGGLAMQGLLSSPSATWLKDVLTVELVNTSVDKTELLNHHCGADFAQKAKEPPASFSQFFSANPDTLFFSFDGDADRVVAFHFDADGKPVLLDGDRIAILLTTLIYSMLKPTGADGQSLDVGIVQTAYANGASTAYVHKNLQLRTYCAATGVKYLHPIAEERDIGVYFEANGHGTVLFHNSKIEAALKQHHDALEQVSNLSKLLSQACGDAVADMLAIILALGHLQWSTKDWLAMYADLPSLQLKVHAKHPKNITCTSDERRALTPPGLQEEIDAIISNCGDENARGFVRPSGTEPLVRVYVEASTEMQTKALGADLERLVMHYCN